MIAGVKAIMCEEIMILIIVFCFRPKRFARKIWFERT